MRWNDFKVIARKLTNDLSIQIAALIVATSPFISGVAQASSSDTAACGACGGGFAMMILVPIAIQVAILVWVFKDSRARGMESPLGWMAFVFFVPLVGILVYLFTRPPIQTK